MDAAAPAMSVMEVSARQASYVDLVCGDVKAQVPGGADNWLQVDGADFVCMNLKNRSLVRFILRCTNLGEPKEQCRSNELTGLHELKELRNNWQDTPDQREQLFDTPPKKAAPRKKAAEWPTVITVDVKLEGWPEIRVLSRNTRDNEYLWVHTEDLGAVIGYVKLKGIDENFKRARHDLPAGIQARKRVKKGTTQTVYIVATQHAEETTYRQFDALADAIAFQQNPCAE